MPNQNSHPVLNKNLPPQAAQSQDTASDPGVELPFFYFVSLSLTFIGAWSIYYTPILHQPARYIPFSLLMILHIGLYWLAIPLAKKPSRVLLYMVTQGLIAFILNLIGQNNILTMGLFMSLIGITVGLLGLSRQGVLIIGFFLALSLISYGTLSAWTGVIWWLIGTVPTMLFVIIYVTLYNRQALERAKAQQLAADLELANRQLSEYAAQVEGLTLTNERQRMARELHDTLSQGLAGLILQLEAADAHLAAQRAERAGTIIRQAMVQARATLADARRAIDDLRQTQGDLKLAFQLETQRFTEATGIPCCLQLDLAVPIPAALCEPIQRTLAEALTNIARHAQASEVKVGVSSRADMLELTIQDNGIGFDPEAAAAQTLHYGLLGIRERARLAGGQVEIQSRPGAGTTLRLCLPYPAQTGNPGALHA